MVYILKKLKRGITCLWYYILGNLIAFFIYKRIYVKGKYFSFKGRGWRWIVNDCIGRILLGVNKGVPWPVSPRTIIGNWRNIEFYIDDLKNFQSPGAYFQAVDAKLIIGKGTWIAPGVGLITSNHDINDPNERGFAKDIILGEKCWIGMNAVILPGVVLGPHTTVGAGAVVTKSFPEGYCVIAGNPAKIIKRLEKKI